MGNFKNLLAAIQPPNLSACMSLAATRAQEAVDSCTEKEKSYLASRRVGPYPRTLYLFCVPYTFSVYPILFLCTLYLFTYPDLLRTLYPLAHHIFARTLFILSTLYLFAHPISFAYPIPFRGILYIFAYLISFAYPVPFTYPISVAYSIFYVPSSRYCPHS
jgi:hypothetical protein